jgi:hypothetical protein
LEAVDVFFNNLKSIPIEEVKVEEEDEEEEEEEEGEEEVIVEEPLKKKKKKTVAAAPEWNDDDDGSELNKIFIKLFSSKQIMINNFPLKNDAALMADQTRIGVGLITRDSIFRAFKAFMKPYRYKFSLNIRETNIVEQTDKFVNELNTNTEFGSVINILKSFIDKFK